MPANFELARDEAEKFRKTHIHCRLFDRCPLDTVFIADNIDGIRARLDREEVWPNDWIR